MSENRVIGNQRVMTAVGRIPTSRFCGGMQVVSVESDVFSDIRQFVNGSDMVRHVVAVVGSVVGGGGAFFCRGGWHPRRTAAITYPFQKGGNTFLVCHTIVKSSSRYISMSYDDVKLSDNIMSRCTCADNCADNCADKLLRKLLFFKTLWRFFVWWCADNCADNCADTKESIRILIKGDAGLGGDVAYG